MSAVEGSASGHPSIRATHGKTLELAREDEITERATCVVGVGARVDEAALAALRGRVELTIACGGRGAAVQGRINPAFRPGDPLIVRRAPAVTRDAVLIGADAVAADLDRGLVERLAVAGAGVSIRFAEVDGAAPGALIVGAGPSLNIWGAYSPLNCSAKDVRGVIEALEAGERVALEGDPGDPDCANLIAAVSAAGHDVLPGPGLGPVEAVCAVAGLRASDALVAPDLPAERAEKWLRRAARGGATRAAIGLDLGTPREQYLAWRPGEPVEIPGARGRTATLAAAQPAARTPSTSSVSRPDPRTSR